MNIIRNGTVPSRKGPADWFTGTVRVDGFFQAEAPATVSNGLVTFEPGARTAWHSHPLGQTLVVTAGSGRVQLWGQAVQEIRAGDIVWIAPGEKHWHGGGLTTAMMHVAIQESQGGSSAEWFEHVTDEQFTGA
jgi:quercetin dioxygenase-like cupin family protein